MKRLRQLPLRVKLVLVMTSLVTIALVLTGIAASTAMRHYLMNRVDGQLKVAAAQISAQAAHDGPNGPDFEHKSPDPDDAPADSCGTQPTSTDDESTASHPLLPSEYFVQIGDASGAPTGQASNFLVHCNAAPAIPAMSVAQVDTRAGAPFSVPARVGSGQWRVVMSALPGGTQTVAVAVPLSDVDNTLHTLSLFELTIGAVVLIVLAGMGYLAVRRSLRPLVDVELTAEAIAEGDLTQRVAVSDPRTEVGRLSLALNKMLGQIESAFRARETSEQQARTSEARMRRFVTDAGHELRTPLTSVRGFAELYRIGGAKQSADVDQMMHRIEAESARMSLLVDELLLLARLDQQRPLAHDAVDLSKVVHDVVIDARAVAPARSIDLQLDADADADADADEPTLVIGDEQKLRQVLANLTSNALTHTPDSASIVVQLRVERAPEPTAVVEVSDTGPGMAASDAARVFERFYRVETSRSRANGGSGLGLSIVAALVDAHGGTVELETAEGIGSTFRVRLPLGKAINERENPADLDE
ncbi:MAG: sensor histidine kinase [Acidothermaceae bacterium]